MLTADSLLYVILQLELFGNYWFIFSTDTFHTCALSAIHVSVSQSLSCSKMAEHAPPSVQSLSEIIHRVNSMCTID